MNTNKKRIDYLVDKILADEDDAYIYEMGEPGYSSTRVLFANWNKKSLRGFTRALEKAGIEPVFCDEWLEIDGKAYRSVSDDGSPLAWVWFDGEPRLKQDIRSDYDTAEDYITSVLINAPKNADTIGLDAYLMQMGFERQEKGYESGLRSGCNDDPADVLKSFNDGGYDVVFQVIRNNDPWVTAFTVWLRSAEWEDERDLTHRDVCFVHSKLSPDSIIAVFLNKWLNDILLASYHYPLGGEYGLHPGIFDDITNGKPIYGTGGDDHWMAMSDTYLGAFTPVVKRLNQEGYKVSVKPCPEKSWVKPFPSRDLLRVNDIKL